MGGEGTVYELVLISTLVIKQGSWSSSINGEPMGKPRSRGRTDEFKKRDVQVWPFWYCDLPGCDDDNMSGKTSATGLEGY